MLQHRLDRGVATRQGVADHNRVGRRIQRRRIVTLAPMDTLLVELRAHRRIDILVGAADCMAEPAGQQGETGHEAAGDTEDMNVHESFGRGIGPRARSICQPRATTEPAARRAVRIFP